MRVELFTALCAAIALVGCSSTSKPRTQDDSGFRTPDPDAEEAPRWEGAEGAETRQPGPHRSSSSYRLVSNPSGSIVPTATFPGFRMLSDGRSRVFVEVSGDVVMTPSHSPGKLTYRFSGVRVPEKVNRLPLPTLHFPTPVARIQLNQVDADAELVIELRNDVTPELHVERGAGAMVLSADFPRPEEVKPAAAALPGASGKAAQGG